MDEASHFSKLGFEVGVHADTGCTDREIDTVSASIADQVVVYGKQKLGVEKQETHRLHCIPWNGWVETVRAERAHGIRFSLNYYYWPDAWVKERQGYMTGSGVPMRFADMDGTVLDVYQSATHIVDENGIKYARGISDMVNNAIGPDEFFGMFATHYDFRDDFINTAIRIAKQKGVALISAAQALRWTDARNTSSFKNVGWAGDALHFDLRIGEGASEVTALLPLHSGGRRVAGIECDGAPRIYHEVRIKGLDYAAASLSTGNCQVAYRDQTMTSIN